MNYERMWLTLKQAMHHLAERETQYLSPETILMLMDNLYDLEDKDDQLENTANALQRANKERHG